MDKNELKKSINEMINQLEEEKVLRRVYLILIVIAGASH